MRKVRKPTSTRACAARVQAEILTSEKVWVRGIAAFEFLTCEESSESLHFTRDREFAIYVPGIVRKLRRLRHTFRNWTKISTRNRISMSTKLSNLRIFFS